MQTAAGDTVRHIGAQLPVGRAGIHICAARPIAQRIDLGTGIQLPKLVRGSIALAEDEPVAVQNVLPVSGVSFVDGAGDAGELLLLRCDTHSFEDAVVAAAKTVTLVVGEMCILSDLGVIKREVTGDTVDDAFDVLSRQMRRCLRNDVTNMMTEQDFDCDARVGLLRIGKVDQGSGDAVCDFIRMGRIHFSYIVSFLSAPGAVVPSYHPSG